MPGMQDDEHNDFASAAMVRLLVRAMAAQGLALPAGLPAPAALAGSHVPLDCKRSVVQAVLAQGGPALLLNLARQVHWLQGDPVHRALLGAGDIPGLLARWQRLERYVHSGHQVSLLSQDPGRIGLHHHARPGKGGAPLPPESLAVLGVLLGSCEALGTAGLAVQLGLGDGSPALPLAAGPEQAALLAIAMARGQASHWTLHWQPAAESHVPPTPAGANPQAALCDALPWPPLAHQIARRVLHDPAGEHPVHALARSQGQASRTLQRHLAAHGLSCRSIATEARTRAAAQWLLDTPHGIAEIGFACGFADQPHFTREFARQVGMTPARYRQAFGAV
ncbi:DNA-binding domain-containing protein, AraC-type [Acidovorax sp. CF316]|uniref:helix-turn-helix transcriptional regulator n=1 Tax=Acidovorax sp. CF316 TaxID=1144317 RepID=UPI00026BE599|nr:AraC family transcriptional regulator [Acidovorax sp. CF316]EJE49311.1 DNA-binding domain-containing protein, AraC-type [Acidovorax sp. CF316]